MATATKKAKDRGVRLEGNTLTIRDGKKATDYTLEPIEGADCLAFNLHKKAGECECYTVQVAGRASGCECLGFLRWGHCKHVDALLALQRAGRLPEPPACRTCRHGRAWAQHGADGGDCCPDCGR